ncbi:unnamed protein product [Mytilus coruscus]|uniref:Uncharacterized protein n=1 Tax=Mytilus coruscus TaxID=42192 RepID=A0A6J8D092_MYTCO|nr:unnamed protein product [Mytilus coruscus]
MTEPNIEGDAIYTNWMQNYSPHHLRQLQLQDSDLFPLIEWIESQYDPSDAELRLQSPATRALWLLGSCLEVIDGVLYYKWINHAHGESIGDDKSSKATEHSLSAHGESIGDDSSSLKQQKFSDMMVIDEIKNRDTTEEPSDNREEVHDEGIYQQYVHRQRSAGGPAPYTDNASIQKKLKIIP